MPNCLLLRILLIMLALSSWACSQADQAANTTDEGGGEQTAAIVENDPERSIYQEVATAQAGVTGSDPVEMATQIFGMQDQPTEGRFQEEIVVENQGDEEAIILITQTGLPDDSIEGIRYRLEFTATGEEWLLSWAGQQMRCYPDRGSQDWTAEICR